MTLVFKEVSWKHPLIIKNDTSILLAANSTYLPTTKKMLLLNKGNSNDATVILPLDFVLQHSEVKLHHNLIDGNIALCSPSVPPLFSDNFDFQTRHDFIYGNQYAAAVTNWKTYQSICWNILHNWVHPLSIETAMLQRNTFLLSENSVARKFDCKLSRSSVIGDGVIIGANTTIGNNTKLEQCVIGSNCKIGSNCSIKGSNIGNNTVVRDGTIVEKSDIGDNTVIGSNCNIKDCHNIGNNTVIGDKTKVEQTDIGDNTVIGTNCNIRGCHFKNNNVVKDNLTLKNCSFEDNSVVTENCGLEFVLSDSRVTSQSTLKGAVLDEADKATNDKTAYDGTEWENESPGGDDEFIGFEKVWSDSESCYSSDSSDDSSMPGSPIPDDTDIFLQEVIDSLARGYKEKLKCDYIILEINFLRYAYNIQLHEVNFFVIRAMLSMPMLINSKSVLSTVKDILKYFRPVLANYIKTKSSMMDCLKAIEESCLKNEWLNGKSGQVIHFFYEMDVVDEDSLLEWQNDMQEDETPLCKEASVVKFFEWLQQASQRGK